MNKKSLIIVVIILVILVCYYFFAPIKWIFGLRTPGSYAECIQAGGVVSNSYSYEHTDLCEYHGKIFSPNRKGFIIIK